MSTSPVLPARAPQEVRLVGADRGRQPVPRPEEIDRARLAVVVGKDGGPRAVLGGQRVVDARDLGHQLRPAEAIAEVLGQRPAMADLGLRRREPERLLVGDVALGREDRATPSAP